MRWSILLVVVLAGSALASDNPSAPNRRPIGAPAALRDALQHIRQGKPMTEQVQGQVAGLPAEVLRVYLGAPDVVVGDDWVYTDRTKWYSFSFKVQCGRVESCGYYQWW